MEASLIIRILAFISVLMIGICHPAPAPTLKSEFICNNIDATTTYYTYLKEPKLQESGYTRGMKTGSFNYLYNGDVALKDTMEYYDGQVDAKHPSGGDHNSTADHRFEMDFAGEKGISTYYAQEFLPSNRAVSAAKKIYYINYSNKSWNLGGIYKSDRISVRGYSQMGANLSNAFAFRYNGQVENGVMQIRDATGWSNKTGARRIDWEQDALMKGRFLNVTNNLFFERGLYILNKPSEDWLPCCFAGLQPPVEPKWGVWPSSGAKAVLKPDAILPSNICSTRNCNCSSGDCVDCSPGDNCTKCSGDSCTSFPCVYTYGEDALGMKSSFKGAAASRQDVEEFFQGIDVTSTLSSLAQHINEAEYLIRVQNEYSVPVEKVILTVNLVPGMKYKSYRYGNGQGGASTPRAIKEPNPTETDDPQVLQWGWEGGMNAKSEMSIVLKVDTKGKSDVSDFEKTTVEVEGLKDGELVASEVKKSSVNLDLLG